MSKHLLKICIFAKKVSICTKISKILYKPKNLCDLQKNRRSNY